ncbi:MAG: energy-coupling factor transporter transmembrane component T [Syntrophales bacterium]|nr:energy-coupling factor transporter transmembrane component T [Syntrophales bacterium]MDD5233047.1 energy-coupling factor transporter transmembrane component T [Syntrophales bacterium]MDD5532575.1 energy-coupling factor transporter transmembrane component T [Syntrophales bacterium]
MINLPCHYIPRESAVHRLDPRLKIVMLILFSLFILRTDGPALAAAACLLVAASRFARTPWRAVYSPIRTVAPLALMVLLAHVLMSDAGPAFSRAGWEKGFLLAGQCLVLVLAASILTATTSHLELIGGMDRLLRPLRRLKLPVQDISMMLSVALRFVPVLAEEARRTGEAAKARGADPGSGSILRRARHMAALGLPLAMQCLLRAQYLAESIEARGYGSGERSSLREFRFRKADYAALAVSLIIFAAFFFYDKYSMGYG